MDLPIEHEDFAGRGLALRPAAFFKGPRLLIDGNEAKGKRLRFVLRDNFGNDRRVRLRSNGLDPIPRVEIDGRALVVARPLAWYEYLWMGLPLILVLAGGGLGALFGLLAVYASARVFRSERSLAAKYGISALISASAGIAFIVGAALIQLLLASSQELEEGDRELVLKIEQLQPYGLSLPEGFEDYERFTRDRMSDGTVTIEYEFSAPKELGLPYLSSTAERHTSNLNACISFHAGNLGTSLGSVELSDRSDLFRFGDKSLFAVLVHDGEPFGNYFGMCHGKTAFSVTLGGIYFDDGDSWGELLGSTLEALSPGG